MILVTAASSMWAQTTGDTSTGDTAVPELVVAPAQNRTVSVEPGALTTIVFSVENRADRQVHLEPTVALPDGWRMAMPLLPLMIEPDSADIALVSFVAPAAARAGRYEMGLSLTPIDAETSVAEASAMVEVPPRRSVDLALLRAPETALSGEEFDVVFLLSNAGNVAQRVDLGVESGRSFPYTLTPDSVELAAGESREITVTVRPPQEISGTTRYYVRLEARSAADPDLVAELRHGVEVIAVTPQGNRWHRFPTTLGWSSSYDSSAADGEPEFSHALSLAGRGTIDDQGRHRLNFSLSPPAYPPPGENAPYDQAYAWEEGVWRGEYENDLFGVRLGDDDYSLSGLTSGTHGGRGVEAYATPGDVTVGGYQVDAEEAVYVGYQADDLNRLTLGIFRDHEGGDESLFSLGGSLRRYDTATVDFETAVGSDSVENTAFRLGIDGDVSRFSYDLDASRASPDFGGTRRDYEYYAVASSLEIVDDVRVSGGGARERNNLNLDPEKYSALAADETWLGAGWKPVPGMNLAGSWRGSRYRDLLPDRDADRRTEMTSVDWSWTVEDIRVETRAAFNVHRNLVTRSVWRSQAYSLAGSYRPTEPLRLNASTHVDSGAAEPGFGDARTSWSVGATYLHDDRTSYSVSYTERLDRDQEYRRRSDLSFHMRHSFPSSASLTLTADARFGTDLHVEDNLRATVSYRRPLDIPVTPRSDIGTVRGRVTDAATGEGVPGVIVSVGTQTAVTNATGGYLFPAIEVGTQMLRADVTRLDRLVIPTGTLPVKVTVRRQESTVVDVEMVAPGAISGSVVTYEIDRSRTNPFSDEPPVYTPGGGARGVIVEIDGPGGMRRAGTAFDGTFQFQSLIPGEWSVRIHDDEALDGYTIEQRTFDVIVESNGTTTVEFAAQAPDRRMKILDQGEALEE